MISDKVRPHHLERKALLYVRLLSSSPAQAITERARQNPKHPAGSHPDQQSLFSSIT